MNDLRALLGSERWADVVNQAADFLTMWGYEPITDANEAAASALAAVLPDLLEWAWEEGYQASVSVIASGDIAFNPYRAAQAPGMPPRSDADAQAAHGDTPGHAGPPERAGMTYTDRERADMKDLGFSPDKIADASPEWVADLDALARRADRSRCRHERAAYVDRGMAEMLRRIARAVRREQRKAAK